MRKLNVLMYKLEIRSQYKFRKLDIASYIGFLNFQSLYFWRNKFLIENNLK